MDRVRFDGAVEHLRWGTKTYTIIRLPADAVAAWRAAGVKRLAGTVDGFPVDLAITRAPVLDDAFVWAGASLLRRIQAEPGEVLAVELGPADADAVATPDDVVAAMDAAGLAEVWSSLTPGRRRGLLHRVTSARSAPTRAKRIAALVTEVRDAAG